MPLEAHVQNRYSTQLLIELTNPDNPAATGINTAKLSQASADVIADFRILAGTKYNDNDERHVSIAVQAVVLKLQIWMTRSPIQERLESRYRDLIKGDLALVTGRNRIIPSVPDLERGEAARAFPPGVLNEYVPNPPITGRQDRKDTGFFPFE